MKIETVSTIISELGEGPVWDSQRNEINWIDLLEGKIHNYSLDNNKSKTFSVQEKIGCFAICENSHLIIATKTGIGLLDRETGIIKSLVQPEKHLPNNRFNDGKCDPMGRFWAGTMSLTEEPQAGSVYVFDTKTIEKKIENVTISNGMAWSLDSKTFYYIDTPTFEVVAYQYEKATANISNKTVVIKIPEEEGYPDGMTIDNEGMLWIAHWDGWQITRWNPNTGEKLQHIKLPASRITSCTFGGTDLSDLYITSARTGLSDEELEEQPLAGSLFVIRNSGFKGVEAYRFNNQEV